LFRSSSADLTPLGGVVGVLGSSADGSYAYYQDGAGLVEWHAGSVTTVAAGADAALPTDWPPTTGTARVTPSGHALAFVSETRLTGYDNTDAGTGEPDSEVFLWREGAGLTCVSCNAS